MRDFYGALRSTERIAMSPTHAHPSAASTGLSSNMSIGMGNATAATWNLGVQRRDRKTWTTIRERVDADIAEMKLTSVELEDILKQLLSIALPNSRIRGEVRLCDYVQFTREI